MSTDFHEILMADVYELGFAEIILGRFCKLE